MAKNPSATWYFVDWENDPALKGCSLAAQGLWKRLLCIAARSPEHGVVQIEGRNSGLPDGLPHLAAAVGRSPEEIAPLIDELLSSGTASRDRKRRLFCRRMVRAAALSGKRAISGKMGADVTHGKRERKEGLPPPLPSKPSGPSRLPDYESSSHGNTITDAACASASPDGPPRPRLTSREEWTERLRTWLETGRWTSRYGYAPDSAGHNSLIPPDLYQWAKAQKAQQRTGAAT